MTAQSADTPADTIGRYELLGSIGKGAQGSVYLGRDPTLDRPVAIKVLTSENAELNTVTEDGASLEGRIAGKLKHPNIVPIYDAGEYSVGPYLVFEYVKGDTLAARLKRDGAMSIENAVPLFAAILEAIAAAHSASIMHLDLSPRNILIDENGLPRIMDFGLAQYVSNAREPKDTATGTLRYMAPEHFAGRPLGPWTDVFALGSTFFEVVTGTRAMSGQTLEQIRQQIISEPVDLGVFQSMPHGDAFAHFLSGAVEKSESGRYTDGGVMLEAFELFLAETELTERRRDPASSHSTIEFLLRRMQRTGDFPTISRTMADINRLTGDDADANADKLANVILRDYALTGKLLKLVNSAFYGTRNVEVTKISEAVVFLGVEKVRMTANSLTFFGHMNSDSAALRDSMTKSFLAGLMARHLAQKAGMRDAEEAFICGMCQNLGENLVIHYFPDEYEAIAASRNGTSLDKPGASRGVLGVSYAELGAAVAKTWNLPGSIIDSIRGVPPGRLRAPENPSEALRDLAVFCNALCDLFGSCDTDAIEAAIRDLNARFAASVDVDPTYCTNLVAAAFNKLNRFAPIFEINVGKSRYCMAVKRWLEVQAAVLEQRESA